MTYDETVAFLFALESTRGWDLKLERVRAALALAGEPHLGCPSVLIAGTNGKGSTAAMIDAALRAAGRRVGLYTSPHLVHFTERIRIDGRELARSRVVAGIDRIRRRIEPAGIALTFFEMATVLAFEAFAEERVDVAVLEVGLGGRLDATNVADPLVSAVTSIGFDHEEFLGSTLDAIAREKAGVMRPGRPVVLGHGLPDEARRALLDAAERVGARPVPASPAEVSGLPVALDGEHMRANAAVALRVLELVGEQSPDRAPSRAAIEQGIAGVRWPGRLDVIARDPLVICDGAHNREGIAALLRALPRLVGERKVRLVFGALRDKPWPDMVRALAPVVAEVAVSTVDGPRGVPASDLARVFAEQVPTRIVGDPSRALADLRREDDETPIVIAGSLYLIGAVYADLLERRGASSVFDLSAEDSRASSRASRGPSPV